MKNFSKVLCVVLVSIVCVLSQGKKVSAEFMLGDLNIDGRIELVDAQTVLKAALKIKDLSFEYQMIADVNEDGKVTLTDVQLVLMRALKIIDTYDAVEEVTLNKRSASMQIGEKLTLIAHVFPADAYNGTVSWSTSNSKVATISNGVVEAVSSGTATITASAGGYTAKCEITVEVPLENLTYSQAMANEDMRHNKVIQDLNTALRDYRSYVNKEISTIRSKYTVYTGSDQQFSREHNELQAKILSLTNQINQFIGSDDYTVSRRLELESKRAAVQKDLDDLNESHTAKKRIEQLNESLWEYEREINSRIDNENRLHFEKLQKINAYYL